MSKAVVYKIHADHPEANKVKAVADALEGGALILYPTDTIYALGCKPRQKDAVERLRAVKRLDSQVPLSLIVPSLSELATYALVEKDAFKLLKALTPGPYTFLLKATKEVPALLIHPKRKVIGLRVTENLFCQRLLEAAGGALVTSSARIPNNGFAETREALFAALENQVDVVVDDGLPPRTTPSTVIDLTTPEFTVVREGLGMESLTQHLR